MPIYVYEPTVYSSEEEVKECCFFEVLQSMKDPALTICPTCHAKIHRAVTTFNAHINFNANKKLNDKQLENTGSSATELSSNSTAKNAARFAARHICSGGCIH